nr:immunoglobulin heavy chain junction region [Macaca mulatta]MOX14687.1 immunoglobulin heavy chain junction region [Macaca mulatta]MOX14874.1 immunoglobulin heavy chain junction region [Macaca mulatta]MOX15161.1 immunoglobulin heavy chain junction region [Macaca mulatta]MOX15220.1 immunoglobulin heavy chain junction region [Macaca mulatta]
CATPQGVWDFYEDDYGHHYTNPGDSW